MTDRLKIPWAVGAPLTGPSRRLFLSPLGLALLGGILLVVLFKFLDWTAELLWFRALGYEDVFWRLLFAEVAMFATAFIPVFVYVLLNLLVPARLADLQSLLRGRGPAGIPQRPNAHRLTPLFILGSAATAAIFGFMFSGEWDRFLRLVWSQNLGTSDPIYFRDIGFYLFVLPFLNLVQSSLVVLTLGGTLMLGLAYLRAGGLQFSAKNYVEADPKILRHITANSILLLTAWAWGYYLDRFGLLTRSAGAVFGAGYTDVHVVLVGLWVALVATLALICLLVWVAATNAPRFAVFGISGYLVILLAALEVIHRIGDTLSTPQHRADPSGLWFGQDRCAISHHRKETRRFADAGKSIDDRQRPLSSPLFVACESNASTVLLNLSAWISKRSCG